MRSRVQATGALAGVLLLSQGAFSRLPPRPGQCSRMRLPTATLHFGMLQLSPFKSTSRTLWRIIALAAALRLGVACLAWAVNGSAAGFHAPDTELYVRGAEQLWRHGEFTIDGDAEILRTPGYSVMLIPGVVLGQVEWVAILLQTALCCVSVFLVYRIGFELTGREDCGLWAAALYAVNPLSVLYCTKILTETLFATATLVVVEGLIRYVREPRWTSICIVGVVLSASVYVRPIAYFLPLLVLALLIAAAIRSGDRGVRFGHAAALAVIVIACVGAWQWRNARLTGYANFSAISDEDVYFQHAAAVVAAQQGITLPASQSQLEAAHEARYPELRFRGTGRPVAERYPILRREGIRVVLGAPMTYAIIHAKGTVRTLLGTGTTQWFRLFGRSSVDRVTLVDSANEGTLLAPMMRLYRRHPWSFAINAALAIWLAAQWLFAGWALLSKRQILMWPTLVVVGVIGYHVALGGGPVGEHRFRHPVMSLICVLAACGIIRTMESERVRRWLRSPHVDSRERSPVCPRPLTAGE